MVAYGTISKVHKKSAAYKAARLTKIPDGSSYFLMDTPHNSPRSSPRNSPRVSPRNSPRNSPRGSPRGSPRNSPRGTPRNSPRNSTRNHPRGPSLLYLRRNIHKVKVSIKKKENAAKKLRFARAINNEWLGMPSTINGIINTGEYIYEPFSRPGALEPENIPVSREASLQFDAPTISTINAEDIIEVHARSNDNTACSSSGGARFRFQENAPERNIMIVSDSAGQRVLLDASLLVIRRA